MGQAEILEFLKKNKDKEFTSNQIKEKLGLCSSSVSRCMKLLRKYNFVENYKKKRVNYYKHKQR